MTALTSIAAAIAGGLGMYYGISGAFELIYYRGRRERALEWKCQPRRWLSPKMRREQLLLGTANMTAASVASGLFVHYIATGGTSAIYFDWREHGLVFALGTTLLYFLLTDAALYWAHRIFHTPFLFRHIHRWHHRYTAPTAFTAAAMHPLEFAVYQSIMLLPLFVLPVHVAGLIFVLVYQNYVAMVDHSGVDLHSWLPWQPPTRFHYDHHVHFHVNYGQNLGLWDRLFGTYRRVGRVYGVDVFGGRGAPARGPGEAEPVRYFDYRRKVAAPPASAAGSPAPAAGAPADPAS